MKNSAILQMLRGERGQLNNVPYYSPDYEEADKILEKAENAIKQRLGDDKELKKLYGEVVDALDGLCLVSSEVFYREGFAFGVLVADRNNTNRPVWRLFVNGCVSFARLYRKYSLDYVTLPLNKNPLPQVLCSCANVGGL